MKLFRVAFSLFLFVPAIFSQAQTVEEVIQKYVDGMGGKEVISKIKTQVIESGLSVMGSELTSKATILVGKGFKSVTNYNGQDIIQCITPMGGWTINPLQGITDAQALPEDQVKAAQSAIYVGGELYNYKEKGSKVELVGRENIEGINTYKIKLVNKEGKESVFYIDPATYYVIKRETISKIGGQDVTSVSTFSNYKKTPLGLVVPYTTITNQGGFEITMTINKIEFNVEVDPKIFEMPK